ncbi:hypothetical protein ACOJR9_16195 [Alteromonas sp. A081]|uniref:hypothetical protein n=1 Tax=Alteromonas sp. A081 TaxID=3410269 RepID=UPI003B980C1B
MNILNTLSLKPKRRVFINGFILFLLLQCAAVTGQLVSYQNTLHSAIDKVERRISLDSAFLDVGNQTLQTPVNSYAIWQYTKKLNVELTDKGYPVLVKSIQGEEFKSEEISKLSYPKSYTTVLRNAEQHIHIEIVSKPISHALTFSWTALIASLMITPAFAINTRITAKQRAQREEALLPPAPKLIINLQDKTISNGVTDNAVMLQNKPLCFYTALVKFCIENPEEPLHPHKDVPNELVALANKSFGRLIELGHTKRKRPDFNANLDKTLSEIRAALDEVFNSFSEEKETYYPPRAQGEGSRSKQHSYALPKITLADIEIIGN